MKKEIWRDVKGYENFYQISSRGRLRSLTRTVQSRNKYTLYDKVYKGKILKLVTHPRGALQYGFQRDGNIKTFYIGRLVAKTFMKHNPDHIRMEVGYKDGNKENNAVENLIWTILTRRGGADHPKARGVIQMNKKGTIIKKFDCAMDVQRALKIACGSVGNVCRGKQKTAGGFRWKYDSGKKRKKAVTSGDRIKNA